MLGLGLQPGDRVGLVMRNHPAKKPKKNESTKKMISHDSLIQEDKLSDSDFKSILERFKNI